MESEGVWPRAYRDWTKAVTGDWRAQLMIGLLTIGVGATATPYASNAHGGWSKAVVVFGLGATGLLSALGILLGLFVVRTPIAQRDEARQRLTEVETLGPHQQRVRLAGTPEVWKHLDYRLVVSEVQEGIMFVLRKPYRQRNRPVECELEDPQGGRNAPTQIMGDDRTARCVFPRDFDIPPESGPYVVQWSAEGPVHHPDGVRTEMVPMCGGWFTIRVE